VNFYFSAVIRRIQENVVARTQMTTQDEGRGSMIDVTGVKVFSATKAKERELLGELITDWIRSHPEHEIVDKIVTQSSDSEFHCLTITLFYKHNAKA
jgi:ribosomal protein S3AE